MRASNAIKFSIKYMQHVLGISNSEIQNAGWLSHGMGMLYSAIARLWGKLLLNHTSKHMDLIS